MPSDTHVRRVEPLATDWRRFSWSSGTFDTARRSHTRDVEGQITLPHALLLVTLSGGARHLEVTAACGHRYAGDDFAGAVSFVPAGCGRRLSMRDVQAEWASISLRPDLLDHAVAGLGQPFEVPTFTNVRDPLVSSLVAEFVRLQAIDQLDPAYCEAMARALAQHLAYRYGKASPPMAQASLRLPAWRLRRITEYVEAHLDTSIEVADLAGLVGLSPGHFHRALRATLGMTPLELINRRRIERAQHLLATEGTPIVALALRVGFASTSHFSRIFRRVTGVSPSEYRSGARRSAT